jgi:pentatricopeptide repeat protein
VNPSLDFKHQKMHDALRLVDNRNPSWMGTKLAATAPGSTYTTTGQMKSIETVSANVTGRCAARLCHLICCSHHLMNVPVWVAIEEGRCAHGQIFQSGCELDAFVGSSLIDMYAKCGSMEDAWRAFNKIPSGNLISCTAMIFEHIELWQKALELF